ncbi:MAG TPA: hypothetical protein VKV80_19780 [Streptosporangiaceae bacterium]|nr:hypothetical protein [Streptosporangiaceae bacterium]
MRPFGRRLLRYASRARAHLVMLAVAMAAVAGLVIVQAQLPATVLAGAFAGGLDLSLVGATTAERARRRGRVAEVQRRGSRGTDRAQRERQARYGIVTLKWPGSRPAPGTNHPTPIRVKHGGDFKHAAGEPASGLPFGDGPAGTSACLR